MRGKVIKIIQTSCSWRITPAYAGKSLLEQEIYDTNTDHPRLCGEKSLTVDKTPFVLGSPPPMRGKVETQNILTTLQGITPAYAGKSPILSNVHEV